MTHVRKKATVPICATTNAARVGARLRAVPAGTDRRLVGDCPLFPALWADGGGVRTTFEWGRIQSNADWILPIAVCLVIVLFVRYLYRSDAVEMHPVLGWLLTALRIAAFLGLLVLYLQPQWRAEREEVRNSRVLLLADTSLSMGLSDGPSPTSEGGLTRAQQSRQGP